MCIYIHFFFQILFPCCCCWITQLCSTLWEPKDCSTPGFPVLHHLPECFQTHVHWVNDTNHLILCCPLLLLSSTFPASGSFQWVNSSHRVAKVLELQHQQQFFQWIFRVNFFYDWLVFSSLLSKGLPKVFSTTTVRKHQFFMVQISHPYMTTRKP